MAGIRTIDFWDVGRAREKSNPLENLAKIYGTRLDTITGCLEVLESMIIGNDGLIPRTPEYNLAVQRFQELVEGEREQGVDVSRYEGEVQRILKIGRHEYQEGNPQLLALVNIIRTKILKNQRESLGTRQDDYVLPALYCDPNTGEFNVIEGGIRW